jgi:3-phenylpropionate/trans-cinnamate dioxygenase ferredoxin component
MAEFQSVGPAELEDGEADAYEVDGRRIAVAHVDGSFYAFDDTCTHQGCSLGQGELDGTAIECPCHGSRFDVTTGSVLQGPAQDPVETFEVKVEDGDLQIAL